MKLQSKVAVQGCGCEDGEGLEVIGVQIDVAAEDLGY